MIAIIAYRMIGFWNTAYFTAPVKYWRRDQNEIETVVQSACWGTVIVVLMGGLGVNASIAVIAIPLSFHIDGIIEFV